MVPDEERSSQQPYKIYHLYVRCNFFKGFCLFKQDRIKDCRSPYSQEQLFDGIVLEIWSQFGGHYKK